MTGTLEVRRATESEIAEIWQLTHDQYARRGYIAWQPGRIFSHYEHLEWIPETVQLIALADGDLVGTVTYTLDGPAKLHTDVDYPEETEIVRRIGIPLASCWRIATDDSCHTSHRVAQALMRETARQLVDRGEPILLCTFHPRHELYYRRRLGFRTIAKRGESAGLRDAPSILMVGGPGSYRRLCGT